MALQSGSPARHLAAHLAPSVDGHGRGFQNTDVKTHEGPILAANIYSLFRKSPKLQGIEATAATTTTTTTHDPAGTSDTQKASAPSL